MTTLKLLPIVAASAVALLFATPATVQAKGNKDNTSAFAKGHKGKHKHHKHHKHGKKGHKHRKQ